MITKIANYFGTDGLLHILCSLILVCIFDIFFPLIIAILLTAIIGIGKEVIYDKLLKKGTFDKKDLIADLIGIILGSVISLI